MSDLAWSVARTPKGDGYQATGSANVVLGNGGWYSQTLVLTDAKGCKRDLYLGDQQDADTDASGTKQVRFGDTLKTRAPIAAAELTVNYNTIPAGSMDPRSVRTWAVVRENKVVDASLHPPASPPASCVETRSAKRARLREKAKTDPDGADAEAIAGMSRNEVFATAINSAGFLCARVTDAYPSGGDIIVHCVEYRSGRGRVKYRVDTQSMQVTQL